MSDVFVIRAGAVYLPIALATGLWLWRRPLEKDRAGILLASAWNAITLLAVNLLAIRAGWWNFNFAGGSFLDVPVDLYLGWVVLWGICAPLAFPGWSLWVVMIL